jgi:hypothetical protein
MRLHSENLGQIKYELTRGIDAIFQHKTPAGQYSCDWFNAFIRRPSHGKGVMDVPIQVCVTFAIASHQLGKNKISLQDDTLYIMGGTSSVFCEPCLSCSMVTSEKELNHYLGEEHPVELLWRAQFQSVNAAAGNVMTGVHNAELSDVDDDDDGSKWTNISSQGAFSKPPTICQLPQEQI